MKKFIVFFLFHFSVWNSFCQENKFSDWHSHEIGYYNTLKGLVEYVHNKDKDRISKDTLFKKYIYFDNVLNDTLDIDNSFNGTHKERRERRVAIFDTIFSHVPGRVNSIGIQNLDARPLRFYKGRKIYRPFESALDTSAPNVMVYYRRDRPDEPLGTLLFDPETHKLLAWILLKQGDSGWFYLTFNLL